MGDPTNKDKGLSIRNGVDVSRWGGADQATEAGTVGGALSEKLGLQRGTAVRYPAGMFRRSPFRYFKTSPEIIRLTLMLNTRFPLSLRNDEDLLHERGIEISHETMRYWWNRFGPMRAAEIRGKRVQAMRAAALAECRGLLAA
ncbi:hypothetical protein [Microcoleus sp. LEGE 07076]|uniref:hypothetical protein n=1 Tax=Microcoleus sp. LEGE 07076 TaxID=915322 RepID=UPI001D147378|nr:hypothetical protein [Microcoleus sp. LEGE 07076]